MRWLLPDSYKRPDGSIRRDWRAYVVALVAVDAAVAAGALALSYLLRFGVARDAFAPSTVSPERYAALAAVVLIAWLVTVRALGLYEREMLLAGTDEYARVVQASTVVLVGVMLVEFVVQSDVVSRGWLFLFWVSLVGFAGSARFLARRGAFLARRWGAFRARVVIAGADDRAVELAQHLHGAEFEVLGFLDDFRPTGASLGGNGWRVLGSATQPDRAEQLGLDEVVVVPSAISWESRQALIGRPAPRRFEVRFLATREGTLTSGVKVSHRAHVPVYAVGPAEMSGIDSTTKRLFDVAFALALLMVAAPIAAVRLALRAVRRQPLVEQHQILGKAGERFTVYSLAGSGSRVISKLPALLNVLRGEMSIVGPTALAERDDINSPELGLVRPGITSVVPAGREHLDRESVLSIQLDYIRSYSIWRDLQVLWHRAASILQGGRVAGGQGSKLWTQTESALERLDQKP